MDTSNITVVAWWGAILSTIVFAWDVYKWRTAGPKLRVSISTGMQSIGFPEYEGKTLVTADVVNYGDRSTTITNLALEYYKNRWSRIRGRKERAFIVSQATIPHELKQGTQWLGVVIQDGAIEEMARNGHLICALIHTHRKGPVRRRITIKKPAAKDAGLK